MDRPLTDFVRVEYVHSDDHLLGALKRYKGLRTYPAASDKAQRLLHEQMTKLAERGLAKRAQQTANSVLWMSAL